MNYSQLATNAAPLLVFFVLIHFLADFALQTHEQATGKSKEWKPLLQHTSVYSLVITLGMYIWFGSWWVCLIFGIITFIAHTATDYITSRISSYYFQKDDYHNGFVVIGFDQVLHYLQLWFTFILISQL